MQALSSLFKETAQKFGAFLFKFFILTKLAFVIETVACEDFFKQVIARSFFFGGVGHFFYAGVGNCSGTHWAWFKCDKKFAIVQSPTVQFFAGFVDCQKFGVVCGVLLSLATVVGA